MVEEPAPGALSLTGETDSIGVLLGSTWEVTGPGRDTPMLSRPGESSVGGRS